MVGHRVSDARHGSDRSLLHANAARAAQPRPRPRRLLPLRGARAGVRATRACPEWTTDLEQAIAHPETDTVVSGCRTTCTRRRSRSAAKHGKAVLCTKPLARTAEEAKRILDTVERAGVFGGYLEDLVYTPKTLKALGVGAGGRRSATSLWARSRETHPGPHSAWFWDAAQAGGGPIVDLGCHCIEIVRNLHRQGEPARRGDVLGGHARPPDRGRGQRDRADPLRVRRDGPVRGQSGRSAAAWTCATRSPAPKGRSGSNHFLRTGFEVFTLGRGRAATSPRRRRARAAGSSRSATRSAELGYVDMFTDMFDAIDEGRAPMETFYDGYVVNAIIDACYRSAERRGSGSRCSSRTGAAPSVPRIARARREHDGKTVIKEEKMPDGRLEADPQGRVDRRVRRRRQLTSRSADVDSRAGRSSYR